LEIGGVITNIRNIKVEDNTYWTGYGTYKDKAFFVKYQILPEMGKFPAIAVGWDDFHGTKLFDTKYFVVSKYIDYGIPENITVGYAKGKLLNGFFWGSEILLHPKWSFLVEYAPINKKELLGLQNLPVKSKVNFGLKFQPKSWFQIVASYQRGNEWGININFDFPMGQNWVPHKPKVFRLTRQDVEIIKKNKQTEFYKKALQRLDLDNPEVYIEGDSLVIEYSNDGYFYESVALKKALSVLQVLYFPKVRTVKVIIKDNNVPVTEVVIPGKEVNLYLLGAIDFKTLLKNSYFKIAPNVKPKYVQTFTRPKWKIMPKVRTFLNDPSGFFKYMVSLDLYLKEYFYNNYRLDAGVFIPLMNNISSVNKPLMSKPVRSDIAQYLGIEHPDFSVLSLSYINRLTNRSFIGVSVGYNELMFAGIGGDILYFPGDGRVVFGVGGDYVWKRDPKTPLGIKNWTYHDEYVSFYYRMEYPEMQFTIKAGRFLAGDKGVRFEVSRIVNGFEVGFWYTYSDTSDFTGPNKNYHDKGVFVAIPLRMFSTKDTKVVGVYSLSP
jgi:hypothetical protein